MSKDSAYKMKILGFDELINQSKDKEERIIEVALSELHSFKNHPYKVLNDEKMNELVESIKESGQLVPGIVRRIKDGGYEIIAGHRRAMACEIARLTSIKVIVMDLNDDEATIIMVNSNIQREHLLFSEKAFAFKMRFEALRHQGSKCGKTTAIQIGEEVNESGRQIQRYIRLAELTTPLLDMVDEKKIAFIPAVDLSYLSITEQEWVYRKILETKNYPTTAQAAKIKHFSNSGELTEKLLETILTNEKRELKRIVLPAKKINRYFSVEFTMDEIERIIFELLENWKKTQGESTNDKNIDII